MQKKRFTFLCNDQERELLIALAEHFTRSQGDTIRFLIRVAGQELKLDLKNESQKHSVKGGNQ